MRIIFLLVLSAMLRTSDFARAGQLVPSDAKSLASAPVVALGLVTATTYDQSKFSGLMEVNVLDVLKGKLSAISLKLPVDNNPISGFDILLNKGDIAVFFIREVKDGKALLVRPGAVAALPKGYFR